MAAVFGSLTAAAKKARATVQAEMGKAAGFAGPYRTSGKQAEDALGGVGSASKKSAAEFKKFVDDMQRGSKAGGASIASMAREMERELAKVERAQARAALGLRPAGGKATGAGFLRLRADSGRIGFHGGSVGVGNAAAGIYGVGSYGLGLARRTAMDIARGAGVETNVGKHIGDAVSLQSEATKLSNSGYMPGTLRNGSRVDPATLVKEVRGIGMATGTSNEETMQGLRDFVGKTGDLATARDVLGDMARLAKATGTNMQDMVAAAGDVSNQLEEGPEKSKMLISIMKTVAGQGKLGAVEIRDMASQMAKLAAAASKFEGGPERAIATMGALAQSARQRGGAASASIAANAASSFAGDLTKGANIKNMKAFGITPFTDATHTKLRDPEEIILQALLKTGGDIGKLGKIFPNKMSMRAVEGFRQVYVGAGGGQAGAEAVNEEFKRLRDTMMGEGEIAASFAAAMATNETQVQLVNNQLGALGETIMSTLLPAVLSIAPVFVELATGAAKFLGKLLGVEQEGNDKNAQAQWKKGATDIGLLEKLTTAANPNNRMLPPEMQMDLVKKNEAMAAPFLKKVEEDEAAMTAAIAAQQARADELGGRTINRSYTDPQGVQHIAQNKLGDLTPEQLRGVAFSKPGEQDSDAKQFATAYLARQQEIALMTDDRDRLHTLKLDKIAGILAGTLDVRVTTGTLTPPVKGAPGTAGGASTPPPNQSGG